MFKFFIALSLMATCQQSNAFDFGSLFSGLASSVANRTSGLSSDFTSGVNNVTSASKTRLDDAVSEATSIANDVAATFSMTFADATNRSVVTSAISAAQAALNNVASMASSALTPQDSTVGPVTVANIVSTAENAVSSAISEGQGIRILSHAITSTLTSTPSAGKIMPKMMKILIKMTAVFMTFMINASSGDIVNALQSSFSSYLRTIDQSVKSLNLH